MKYLVKDDTSIVLRTSQKRDMLSCEDMTCSFFDSCYYCPFEDDDLHSLSELIENGELICVEE